MANYRILPFQISHGLEIIKHGMNDPLMDLDATYYDNKIESFAPGLSFTLFTDNIPIVAAGIFPLWQGTAEGWALSSKEIFNHKIKSAALIKRRMDLLCLNNKVCRLQTAVKANFDLGIRFAKWLGLNEEGLMVKYGPDGSDYYRMAKIYKL